MGRRYSLEDLDTDEKPRIVLSPRDFQGRTYPYRCEGRTSTGYGLTPGQAYSQWLKNWKRRYAWYSRHLRQVAHASPVLKLVPQGKQCYHCGQGGFHWAETDKGWRLFDSDDTQHACLKRKT